jgi:hypothetical protein
MSRLMFFFGTIFLNYFMEFNIRWKEVSQACKEEHCFDKSTQRIVLEKERADPDKHTNITKTTHNITLYRATAHPKIRSHTIHDWEDRRRPNVQSGQT